MHACKWAGSSWTTKPTEPTGADLPVASCSCLLSCLLPFCTATAAAARVQVALQVPCSNQLIPFHRKYVLDITRVHKCGMMLVGYPMGHQASGVMRATADSMVQVGLGDGYKSGFHSTRDIRDVCAACWYVLH